ncbi:MAG: hypothetical protein JSR72_05800 [Proteobacteria bacterium]|nr:hypothetical protein [Pseudomonadota bacterium]
MPILSRSQISLKDIIAGYAESSARASTYDLRIGCVIDSKGTVHREEYKLKPQEVAWIVSSEIVSLPSDVTAMAHIKTGLCNEGILALNTGMVDPLWSGPLSTPLLNFGKSTHLLKAGDQFLRLTFHSHASEAVSPIVFGMEKYVSEKRTQAIQNFGDKFLDANEILKEALNANLIKFAGAIGIASAIFVAVVAAVLTLGAIIINSNAYFAQSYYNDYHAPGIKAEKDALEKRLRKLDDRLSAMENR